MTQEEPNSEAEPRSPRRQYGALHRKLLPIAAVLLALAALKALVDWRTLRSEGELDASRLLGSIALTCLSYLVLTGYDALGVRYIGRELPYRRVAFAAFEGFAFSQSFGGAGLTGATIRYRLYTGWGLGTAEVAALIVFNSLSYCSGDKSL